MDAQRQSSRSRTTLQPSHPYLFHLYCLIPFRDMECDNYMSHDDSAVVVEREIVKDGRM